MQILWQSIIQGPLVKLSSLCILVLFACSALLVGMGVYLFTRSPETVYFLSNTSIHDKMPYPALGIAGQWIPTFVHVYAFSLLSVAVFARSRSGVIVICGMWLLVDSLLELAQIDTVAGWIAGHVPAWFAVFPILDNMADYFLSGTFDLFDLVSILAGAFAAYMTVVMITRGRLTDVAST
jgi:hypothetical protein